MRSRLPLGTVSLLYATMVAVTVASASCWAVADESASDSARAENTITVHLASGRTFVGTLDAKTGAAQLWLRFDRAGAELQRPIDWDRVVSAEVAGQTLSGDELRRLVTQLRQETPAEPVETSNKTSIVMIGQSDAAEPIAAEPVAQPLTPPRVASLTIEARVARWDENVDPDGLLVRVYPLDAEGNIVPVHGTLTVDLMTERRDQHPVQDPFLGAGHWTEIARPADFGPGGAVYRLRFQGIHPEFDDRVRSPGLVHACLSVPGHGTYEASAYLSFVRPFSPVRDRLQAATRHGYFPGYRYFPNERTDDGRR